MGILFEPGLQMVKDTFSVLKAIMQFYNRKSSLSNNNCPDI